jgi:hypothetical protein
VRLCVGFPWWTRKYLLSINHDHSMAKLCLWAASCCCFYPELSESCPSEDKVGARRRRRTCHQA